MYASVHGSGSVVFQGKGFDKWLKENQEKLSKSYHSVKPIKPKQVCNICSDDYTEDMIKCRTCQVWIHKDCDISNIIDSELEKFSYKCPVCRESSSPTPNSQPSARGTMRTRRGNHLESPVESEQNISKEEEAPLSSSNQTFTIEDNSCAQSSNKDAIDTTKADETFTMGNSSVADDENTPVADDKITPVAEDKNTTVTEDKNNTVAEEKIPLTDCEDQLLSSPVKPSDSFRFSHKNESTPSDRSTSYSPQSFNDANSRECESVLSSTIAEISCKDKTHKTPLKENNLSKKETPNQLIKDSSSIVPNITTETTIHDDSIKPQNIPEPIVEVEDMYISDTIHHETMNLNVPLDPVKPEHDEVIKQFQLDEADIERVSSAIIQSKIHQKLKEVETENDYLKNRLIATQTKQGELEMKLSLQSAEHEEEIEKLTKECEELQQKVNGARKLCDEKPSDYQQTTLGDILAQAKLKQDNVKLAEQLKEVSVKMNRLVEDNISLNCHF